MTLKSINLFEVGDDRQFPSGTIFRIYNVRRLDVIKHESDLKDEERRKLDFYDFLLVDTNALSAETFSLINVTLGSNNKGEIFCILKSSESRYFLGAKVLKEYFAGSEDVHVLEG